MSNPRPAVHRLSDLNVGERGTFFALLAERTRGTTQTNKPFYTCRFKDLRRTATYMVWADGPFFKLCDTEWQAGQFFKIRALYDEHDRYGPQIDVEQIRRVQARDEAEGFDPTDFVEQIGRAHV